MCKIKPIPDNLIDVLDTIECDELWSNELYRLTGIFVFNFETLKN